MISVAPGFFKPQLGGGSPPEADITCEDTYGETFFTALFDTFSTDGALNGASAETSPESGWTYSETSAVRSDGTVEPATFTVSGPSQVAMVKALVSVNMATGETLTIDFPGADYTIKVVLELGAGEECEYSIIWTGEYAETITDTFSIGATAGEVTVGFDGRSTSVGVDYEMYLYVAPDLVTTPAATLVQVNNSFPSSYTQLFSVEFACTGSNTSVNFIRVCGESGS